MIKRHLKTENIRKVGICFILEGFYPVIHGATTQIMLLAERLVRFGLQVMVITRQIKSEHPCCEKIKGVDIFRVKPAVGLNRCGKYLMLAPAFFKLIKNRNRYDFIIVCDFKILGVLGVITAKLLKKRCLLRAESCGEMNGAFATQFKELPSRFKFLLIKTLVHFRNKLLMRSDGFLSISSAITREFIKASVPYNMVIEITNGVDTMHFAPVDIKKKNLLKRQLGLYDKKNFL